MVLLPTDWRSHHTCLPAAWLVVKGGWSLLPPQEMSLEEYEAVMAVHHACYLLSINRSLYLIFCPLFASAGDEPGGVRGGDG